MTRGLAVENAVQILKSHLAIQSNMWNDQKAIFSECDKHFQKSPRY